MPPTTPLDPTPPGTPPDRLRRLVDELRGLQRATLTLLESANVVLDAEQSEEFEAALDRIILAMNQHNRAVHLLAIQAGAIQYPGEERRRTERREGERRTWRVNPVMVRDTPQDTPHRVPRVPGKKNGPPAMGGPGWDVPD